MLHKNKSYSHQHIKGGGVCNIYTLSIKRRMLSSSNTNKVGSRWNPESQLATERSALLASSRGTSTATAAKTTTSAITTSTSGNAGAGGAAGSGGLKTTSPPERMTTKYLEDSVRIARESNEIGNYGYNLIRLSSGIHSIDLSACCCYVLPL